MPPKKKTTKKASVPKKVPAPSSRKGKSKKSSKMSREDKKVIAESSINSDVWGVKAEYQKKITKAKVSPKILIFAPKWTGKTHVGLSAVKQKRFESNNFIFPNFSPVRVIDCEQSADIIAGKDFTKEYKNGDIVIINPYIHPITGESINDPIERYGAVKSLIKSCNNFTDGCLVIDGFDQIEFDCKYYIYRRYSIYERSDGTLWYKEKKEYKNGGWKTVPEQPVGGIIPRMYGPRNDKIRSIMIVLKSVKIPVIMIAHDTAEYDKKTEKPTGKVISNLREFVEDDMDFMIYFENFTDKKVTPLPDGTSNVEEVEKRRLYAFKNRFQKGKSPRIVTEVKDSFEFADLFSIMINGE